MSKLLLQVHEPTIYSTALDGIDMDAATHGNPGLSIGLAGKSVAPES
jgi:hypothetical protein